MGSNVNTSTNMCCSYLHETLQYLETSVKTAYIHVLRVESLLEDPPQSRRPDFCARRHDRVRVGAYRNRNNRVYSVQYSNMP
jgi:hypothetical protein